MAGKKKSKNSTRNNIKKKSGGASASSGQTSSAHGQTLQQDASPLFHKIPQEIRDKIYDQVFAYTRLSHGEKPLGRINSVKVKPAPHSLALLRTCHRIKDEIGDRWLRQVLFHFEDPLDMLDKLTALPHRVISQLRHVRVRAQSILLTWPDDDDDVHYTLHYGLKLTPGLKLDVLTVMGYMPGADVQYNTLNRLIRDSDGWKELRFLSSSSKLLGYEYKDYRFRGVTRDMRDLYLRKPQPADWQSVLNLRDGVETLPSVAIYRSKTPGGRSSSKSSLMANPANWEPFQQKDIIGNGRYGTVEDPNIMSTPDERDKEVLVIARRGKGVDYQEKENSRYIEGDIRREAPGKRWKEIRKMCIDDLDDMYADEDDWPFSDEEDPEPTIPDSYAHVDDYEWTALDFDDMA
ncbi:hypothetical protein V8F06_014820 [Rhypophila decipiens]